MFGFVVSLTESKRATGQFRKNYTCAMYVILIAQCGIILFSDTYKMTANVVGLNIMNWISYSYL